MRILKALAAATLLSAILACGLLSFTIDTGWQTIKLDTAKMGIKIPGGATKVPSIPCTSDKACGAAFKCGGSGYTCALKCVSKKCEIHVTAETGMKVDVSKQIKNKTTATVLSKVELDHIVYNTEHNDLTFDTPSISVYVGPEAATKTTSAGVAHFFTFPVIKSKQTPDANLPAVAAGTAFLENHIRNSYQSPFKMLGSATMKFRSGDPVPAGRIELKVKAYFTIDPLD